MDNEQPHQELVKCVLVGDTAVGKTRLICARACNKHVSLSQLLSTHVPTVWAIDQYRIYKDVLERSWEVIDSVNVSLRLWDTFGDHEKDRRFAYGRSDVVLLCFSIANPVSLRNCRAMWYPEIRRFCPQTPVILVGCKNDLRYMYRDETYLSYIGDRSPFVRAARKCDIVMPDEARLVAKELGVAYYETSVFTYFGVNEVFENAIRAALIARRQQRFWMTNLKRVQRPLLQAPFRPPKPSPPEVTVLSGTYSRDMLNMYNTHCYTDLVLVVGNNRFPVHRFMLAAGSPVFHRLLILDYSDMGARSSSESSMVSSTFGDTLIADFNEDTELLIRCDQNKQTPNRMWEQLKRRSSYQALPTVETKKPSESFRDLHHPIFQNIRVIQIDNSRINGIIQTQTIVTLSKVITPLAMQQCIKFIYTGTIDKECLNLQEIRQTAEFLELIQLTALLELSQNKNMKSSRNSNTNNVNNNFLNNDSNLTNNANNNNSNNVNNHSNNNTNNTNNNINHNNANNNNNNNNNLNKSTTNSNNGKIVNNNDSDMNVEEPTIHFTTLIKKNLEKMYVSTGMFGDVTFELDDGSMKAHRAMLVARCDVMRAMLNGDFKEAHTNLILFPGVTEYTFHKLLCYLYTDEIPPITADKCLNLLELANRLCLPRLLNLIECRVIEDLTRISQNETGDAVEHCLKLLEPVKLHNAHQLAEWCMSYLCVNYNVICKKSPKSLKALHPDNQDYLREHRWPPVWYLKDYDYYQRCLNELKREINNGKKSHNDDDGCLCFSGVEFNINLNLEKVFSWLTGKSRRNDVSTGIKIAAEPSTDVSTNLLQSNANSINHIDPEPEGDLIL